jgi:hypothetical protein
MRDPRLAQERLLREMLATASSCEFGQAHGFASIRSTEEYRACVPMRDYEGFRPFIERMAAGEPRILTADEVVAFEETGGSSGGAKLIPYTRRSLDAFAAAILPWMGDLLKSRPRIASGRAYFAVSPATRAARKTQGGLPVGLASDEAYLGERLGGALSALSVVPPEVARIRDVEEWLIVTAACLVAAEDLSFISIWSPTFLSGLLEALRSHSADICSLLRAGEAGLAPNPARADLLESLLEAEELDTARLWPNLDTISAWQDGSSAPYARRLQAEMPATRLQGKGLLATEGVVSLPISLAVAPLPALTSTVLEFIDAHGQSHLVDELEVPKVYRVVMTSWSGLYRYDLGDNVTCCGHLGDAGPRGTFGRVPLLRFVGRAGIVSDLVGEKLNEAFVSSCVAGMRGFCALFPMTGPPAGYGLIIDAGSPDRRDTMVEAVDRTLRLNPQYDHARRHGQLTPLRMLPVERAQERYVSWALAQGRRLSDIKPVTLISDASLPRHIWPAEFNVTHSG